MINIICCTVSFFLSEHTTEEKPLDITNKDASWFDFIDAEKYSTDSGGNNENQSPWGDSNLCWAASASDMLTYTGWSGSYTEDQVFTSFSNAFFNLGLMTDNGLVWYLNGVNPSETNTDDNGDIVLLNEITDKSVPSSERLQYTGTSTTVKAEYSANQLFQSYDINNLDGLSDALVVSVDNGDAVGLVYEHVLGTKAEGSHAVTIFGYICQTGVTGSSALKALFISDSDTDYTYPEGGACIKDASDSLKDRISQPNKYTLYYTSKTTNLYNAESFEIYPVLLRSKAVKYRINPLHSTKYFHFQY